MNNNPSNPVAYSNEPSSDPVGVNNTPISNYNLPTFRLGTQTGPCYVALKNSNDKFYCPICKSVENGSFRIISHNYNCPNKNKIYCQQPEISRELWLALGINPNTGENILDINENFNGGKRKRKRKTHRKRKVYRRKKSRRDGKKN